ncbi:hypothetical protein PF010_g1199 [Phytophthora fragariae]|uniref:Uncharacterized protein n=1 Tax=Phytophthora fragariae TaxID=53985 RepID=A0A6A3MM63_9STRA|nr:hypothetical protein PF011_g910 [Phytophthora fragariae]KAE9137768.1 hypothetical protein PF010_g1199 [Phytophthora fragariae]
MRKGFSASHATPNAKAGRAVITHSPSTEQAFVMKRTLIHPWRKKVQDVATCHPYSISDWVWYRPICVGADNELLFR